jgi:hypothetical protein
MYPRVVKAVSLCILTLMVLQIAVGMYIIHEAGLIIL